jgi:hypothetical protein
MQIGEHEIEKSIFWYDEHSKLPRVIYRGLGVLTIFLSVAIPFLSQDSLTFDYKMLWITGLSLSITVITGITQFFKPDQAWKLNMGAKLNLESLYTSWKLEMIEVRSQHNKEAAIERCISVSRSLLKAAQNVTASNTEGFFANIRFPETK